MNVGIIGSGAVGQVLAKGFFKHGYSVMIGTRSKDKLLEWSKTKGQGIAVGDFNQTAAHAEVFVLAVKGEHAIEALKLAGSSNLDGKIVIDTTNPIDSTRQPVNGVLPFFTSLDDSLMEMLQNEFSKARFVKAFNSVGSALMVEPRLGARPTMFICGNNQDAKDWVSKLLDTWDWEVSDMGMMESARAIEPLCMLWCIPGFLQGKWSHAFKLVD